MGKVEIKQINSTRTKSKYKGRGKGKVKKQGLLAYQNHWAGKGQSQNKTNYLNKKLKGIYKHGEGKGQDIGLKKWLTQGELKKRKEEREK